MNRHYRPSRSGKRSLATALLAPLVLAAGVLVALDHPAVVIPTVVTPPDAAKRFTNTEAMHAPSPPPAPAAAVVRSRPVAAAPRAYGPGVFKCEDSNGAVTYSQFPCGDAKLIDTRPTSGGFAENWSITVKQSTAK